MSEVRTALLAIEADLDAGRYQPGTWQKRLNDLRQRGSRRSGDRAVIQRETMRHPSSMGAPNAALDRRPVTRSRRRSSAASMSMRPAQR